MKPKSKGNHLDLVPREFDYNTVKLSTLTHNAKVASAAKLSKKRLKPMKVEKSGEKLSQVQSAERMSNNINKNGAPFDLDFMESFDKAEGKISMSRIHNQVDRLEVANSTRGLDREKTEMLEKSRLANEMNYPTTQKGFIVQPSVHARQYKDQQENFGALPLLSASDTYYNDEMADIIPLKKSQMGSKTSNTQYNSAAQSTVTMETDQMEISTSHQSIMPSMAWTKDLENILSHSQTIGYLKDVVVEDQSCTPTLNLLEQSSNILRQIESIDSINQTVAPDDTKEIKKLRTGDDAVSFFSNASMNTAVKFVYLNRAPPKDKTDFNPYELVVCDREETNPEYFTMSASGIVHVRPTDPTEFISLSDWMKESTTFNVLRRIRFFKYYLVFKCFKTWHKSARYSKYCKLRAKLSSHLFVGKSTFASTLLDIKAHSYKLQSLPIMDFTEKKTQGDNTYNIEEFHLMQKKIRQESSSEFESLLAKIQQKLLQLCKLVTSRAQVDDTFHAEKIEQFLKSGSDVLPKDELKSNSKRSKSMVQQQREKLELQTALRRARRDADMLGNFIRLCDYMCVESLVYLAKQTLRKFYVSMVNMKAIVFKVTIDFSDEKDIAYKPTRDEILNMFNSNSDEIIGSVSKLDRLIYLNAFKIYLMDAQEKNNELRANLLFSNKVATQASNTQYMNLSDTLRKDIIFSSTQQSICAVLKKKFKQALDYGRNFENLKHWYSFGVRWNSTEYAKRQHTVRQFVADLDKVKKALMDLKRMTLTEDFGILVLESRNLKKTLEPMMLDIEEQINASITETSREMCKQLLIDFRERIKSLKERPTKLQEFGLFVHNLIEVKEESRLLMDQAEEVEKMYDLASKNKVQISTTDVVHLEELKEEKDNFVVQIHDAENFREDNILGRTKELEENVAKVNAELFNTMAVLRSGLFVSREADIEDVLHSLSKLEEGINSLRQRTERFSEYKRLFSGKAQEWTNLREVEDQFQVRKDIWTTLSRFKALTAQWKNTEIEKIDGEEIEKAVNEVYITAHHLYKRTQDHVTEYLKENVKKWKERLPVITMISNNDLKQYHWQKIFKGMGVVLSVTSSYSLKHLADLGIYEQKELVTEISNMATGEADLQKMIFQIDRTWKSMDFIVKPYRDRKDAFVLGSVDDIVQQLEDHLVVLQTMQASPYISGVKTKVIQWEKKLKSLQIIIEEWLTFQRKWMYLEFIFSSDDISRQLHDEAAKFGAVNEDFMTIMKNTNMNKNALNVIQDPALLDSLQNCNRILDEVQKNLEDFLGTKREAFPRFFFLSNDELVEILSQTREPRAVQPYLSKCFDSIKYLEFRDDTSSEIIGFLSDGLEAEHVSFMEPIFAVGNVETWLKSIETSMQSSLHDHLKASLTANTNVKREMWLTDSHLPSQCIITADMIRWTAKVEKALVDIETDANRNALIEYHSELRAILNQLVELIQKSDLSYNLRIMVNSLLVLHTHNIEVVRQLIDKECNRLQDFLWQMQLRYYWEMSGDGCVIRQTNTMFTYGYEYVGNHSRLVITPLSERCIMTLTGALNMKLGGNPMGPAGTGKTETIRDLSKALARHTVIFNCSEGLGVLMLRQMFAGLAQSGAWACFDEFNRIDVEVLSVVAQYMRVIQQALFKQEEHFLFDGREMILNHNYGVFVTMNPGYIGRTELPDNLKSLFRPVAMMIPDYKLIAEIMMYAEGFESASSLAQKLTQLFKLSSDQLSKQHHYDFGMRAVKSILVRAGILKRRNKNISEEIILIRAIIDSNTPKFLTHDASVFLALLADFFPHVSANEESMDVLEKAIAAQATQSKLQIVESQIYKAVQLFKIMEIRHGVILVGAPGSGKTTAYTLLRSAITQLSETTYDLGHFNSTNCHVLNPKAILMEELYGNLHEVTKEWHDGLVAHLSRIVVREKSSTVHWIVFDGPVDSLWIENMNTVLDDSKMLCLTNGERIKLPQSIRLLFEVHDLSVASPATVSRCGVIYFQPEQMGGYVSHLQSWMQDSSLPPTYKDDLEFLFEHFVSKTLSFIRNDALEIIPSIDLNLLQSMTRLLDVLLTPEYGFDVESGEYTVKRLVTIKEESESSTEETQEAKQTEVEENIKIKIDLQKMLRMYFIFSLVWSLGANVIEDDRGRFDKLIRRLIAKILPDFPEDGHVYDYFVNIEEQRFVPWTSKVASFQFEADTPFWNILVPTAESTRTQFVMEMLLRADNHILLSGGSGVGKSSLTEELLRKSFNCGEQNSKFHAVNIQLSAQTTSRNITNVLNEKLDQKRKNVLGANSPGHKKIVFIDNANMPEPDKYGSQPPLELVRQVIGGVGKRKGFYDLKRMFFKRIEDTIFILACTPAGGGRREMSPRLLRHFHFLNIPKLSKEDMYTVYDSIISGFFQVNKFEEEIVNLSSYLIEATLSVYKQICSTLLPRPNTPHYTFNLRDVSALIQGVMQVSPDSLQSKSDLINLWIHESSRVFRDRLCNENDRTWFDNKIYTTIGTHFDTSNFIVENVLYGDFAQPDGKKQYQLLPGIADLSKLLQSILEDYRVETNNPSFNFVFFEDAIQHLCRLCRILRQPRGNALLIGVAGCGRKTLSKLASFIVDYSTVEIEVNKNFKYQNFLDNVKKLLMKAGCEGKPVVLLLTDIQIVDDRILEVIHNILNSGEVPNLFQAEDYDLLIKNIRPKIPQASSLEAIYKYFVQLIRENLHIILCLSPISKTFRDHIRKFPSLVNNMTIDWYDLWPKQALYSVAEHMFEGIASLEGHREAVCNLCVHVAQTVEEQSTLYSKEFKRSTSTTPSNYLQLLNIYESMLRDQKIQITQMIQRLSKGITKLQDTNAQVATMQIQLKEKQPLLEQAVKDTSAIERKLIIDKERADEMRAVCIKEEKECQDAMQNMQLIKDSCQADLDQAMPAYHAALKSLKSINRDDIYEIRSFGNPPVLVQTVMEAVCVLFNKKPTWESSQQLLNDVKFLSKLETYDKEHVPEKTLKKLQHYISLEDFDPERVKSVNQASTSLCMWVIAIDGFAKVLKKIEPKRKKLVEAEQELAKTKNALEDKRENLREIENRIEKLQTEYELAIQRRKDLNLEIKQTQERLERAEKLLELLSSERIRWTESVDKLQNDFNNLSGNILIASAIIAYFGPFNQKYRDILLKSWMKECKKLRIPCSQNFSLLDIVEEVQIRDWINLGLPNDDFSKENAILSQKCKYWPLFIDPQGEANNWIRQMEKANGLKVMKEGDPDMMRTLEAAVRVGIPCLLEDVSEKDLDPSLEPLLLKQVFKQGGRTLIHLNDQDVDYNKNFKLYMTTKIANPHYSPEMQIKVSLINFTVTLKGLEDQLLSEVVAHEKADLEKKKNALITQISVGRIQLKELEDKILEMLYKESDIHLLDDIALIDALRESKLMAESVQKSLDQAEVTAGQIYESRELYRPISTRGSILYFVISNLSMIDPMYQYSLSFFKSLFRRSLSESTASDEFEKRLENLINYTTEITFLTISRGLFQKDRLLFSFLMTIEILKHSGIISEEEWRFFLRNKYKKVISSPVKWLNDLSYTQLVQLKNSISGFGDIVSHLMNHQDEWSKILESESPFDELLPAPYDIQLSQWKKLLLLKILHPRFLTDGIKKMVRIYMGSVFVSCPSASIHDVYKESISKTPIIFALSPGADPLTAFTRFATDMNHEDKVLYLSLGQGQGTMAHNLIMQASYTGEWVFLQNCHLAISWMLQLEKIVKELQERDDVHTSFRLFLTSMPSKEVPVTILQNSLKFATEPPRGLKENLKQSLATLNPTFFEMKNRHSASKPLLFSLLIFHGILQERKKFGSLGWNLQYDWNYSDLEAAFKSFELLMPSRKNMEIPWSAFQYIISVIHYGGRVTDFHDLKCVETIFSDLFAEKVLEDGFNYGDDQTMEYVPPSESYTYDELKNYVESLPDDENPRLFGLHENANITINLQENAALLDTLILMEPVELSTNQEENNPSVDILKLVEHFEKNVPNLLNMKSAHKDTFRIVSEGLVNSMGTFLQQEITSYNALLHRVRSTLEELKDAINGLVVMSKELEDMYNAFLFQKVPQNWSSIAYPSKLSLSEWFDDLCSRVEVIKDWMNNGVPSQERYKLGVYFYPQSFLTCVLQTFARKYKTPIDTLTFKAIPLSDTYTKFEDGVAIDNLYLEGAAWNVNRKYLMESEKGVLITQMPLIHLLPCRKEDLVREIKTVNLYECPLYRTADRSGTLSTTGVSTNYVVSLHLNAGDKSPSEWTKRSVALLCSK